MVFLESFLRALSELVEIKAYFSPPAPPPPWGSRNLLLYGLTTQMPEPNCLDFMLALSPSASYYT